jgi:glycosyltransferase involved in cell wall biosynthesis
MTDISVVTPAYNRAALLPRVWQSMREQDAHLQWVVADDGSADDTTAIVAGFNDPRIRYVRLPVNRGVNAARNAGAKAACGRYVVFLDSDDELYPGILPRMLEVMEAADESIGVCAFACVMAATGQKISRLAHGGVLDERQVVCGGSLQQGGDAILVYRREVFDHFQLPEEFRGCEQVFVYQLSQRYRYLLIDEPGSIVHRQGDNLSGVEGVITRSRDIAVSYERILKNHARILAHEATARSNFLRKAMYRYGVAGLRRDAWRVYRQLIAQTVRPTHWFSASVLFLLSVTTPRQFERWRFSRAQRGMPHTESP